MSERDLPELVSLVQCQQHVSDTGGWCQNEPELFFFWPGARPIAACASHAAWACEIAKVMGFQLTLQPFSVPLAERYRDMPDDQPVMVPGFPQP